MPFGLCNAPATFQRCMMAIFSDMIGDYVDVFMDDFSIFEDDFDSCLDNLTKILKRCIQVNLVLSWEKSHFMVRNGIVLGHRISKDGLEVDHAKSDIISHLPPPSSVMQIRSFMGHVGFYRRFIKDFSKIAQPLTNLLVADAPFDFDSNCHSAFMTLRNVVSGSILQPPDWSLDFEMMCDASDFAVKAVLGQRQECRRL
jgi:hypothetical protein